MTPDSKLKQDSGYAWVTARVETVTPFGSELVRRPAWYGPGEEDALTAELERISLALAWSRERSELLTHRLSRFRDIRNSLHRTGSTPMDLVELFEIKHFLLHLEQLISEYSDDPLPGIHFSSPTGLLELLDPTGRRLPSFRIEGDHAPALERIRAEKEFVEEQLRRTDGANLEEWTARRRELVQQEDAAELDARRRLTAALLREREFLLTAMSSIGRLDLILAKAALARKYNCTRPVITTLPVVLDGMIHPQVAGQLEERGLPFTPVSVELAQGVTVITGANMGGKSISLKSVVLNLLLMHTGYFIFASQMVSPLFASVDLIGADEQSVERGLSSFAAEVKRLDDVLRQTGEQRFFLALDEFARGTNPREGALLARALVRHLGTLNCVAMLSTHYDGVADAGVCHYQVAGLDETAKAMDYRLIPAPPDAPCPKDALKVCRLLGLEENLLAAFEKNS